MVLGPLDRRSRKTRCHACSRRRIKCEGGMPCLYCTKLKILCIPPVQKSTSVVFVNEKKSRPSSPDSDSLTRCYTKSVPLYRPENTDTKFVHHFFSNFITRNNFAVKSLDFDTLITQFQYSPGLHHAFVAIGALSMSRSPDVEKEASMEALASYRRSIVSFQSEMKQKDICQSNSGLWTPFFLGIFELMYDTTGESWLRHILHGTSKILQLRGPNAHLTGPGRSFFLTVRVFEICRSLIYSEPSFLCDENWKSLAERMWNGDLVREWHPKEALFDLMLDCSALVGRVWEVVNPDVTHSYTDMEEQLLVLASEGLFLQDSLHLWHLGFEKWQQQESLLQRTDGDGQSALATLYFHAISIFLSGIFDYRPQFAHILTPSLPQDVIVAHVDAILVKTRLALDYTNLAPVLFFFPLRVAGARAVEPEERCSITNMFNDISNRNYVVANALKEDLNNLWRIRGY